MWYFSFVIDHHNTAILGCKTRLIFIREFVRVLFALTCVLTTHVRNMSLRLVVLGRYVYFKRLVPVNFTVLYAYWRYKTIFCTPITNVTWSRDWLYRYFYSIRALYWPYNYSAPLLNEINDMIVLKISIFKMSMSCSMLPAFAWRAVFWIGRFTKGTLPVQ